MPVETERQRRPAGLRAQLFLTHVVRPAAARLADTAAHHQQIHDAAVDHVVVVPVVQRRAEDDHGLAVGLVGVVGEFARHRDDVGARHAAVLLGPGRGVGHVVVVAGRDVRPAEAAVDAVVGHGQVIDRGDAHVLAADADDLDRQVAAEQFVMVATEVGQRHFDDFVVIAEQGQLRLHVLAGIAVAHFQVPRAGLAPAETDGAVGRHQVAGVLVVHHRLPLGVVVLPHVAAEVGGAQVAVGDQLAFMLLQHHQHGMVVVLAAVAVEIFAAALVVEFGQDDVAHRQRQRGVGALFGGQPDVAELHHFAEVGRIPPRSWCPCSAPRCRSGRPGCGSAARWSPTPSDRSSCTSRPIPARRSARPTPAGWRAAGRSTSHRRSRRRRRSATCSGEPAA